MRIKNFPNFRDYTLFLAIFLTGINTRDFLVKLKYYDDCMFWLYVLMIIVDTVLIKMVHDHNRKERKK